MNSTARQAERPNRRKLPFGWGVRPAFRMLGENIGSALPAGIQ